jgi:hypothetical protein
MLLVFCLLEEYRIALLQLNERNVLVDALLNERITLVVLFKEHL